MHRDRSIEHLVEKAFRHWEARERASSAPPLTAPLPAPSFTIALARSWGTPDSAIGHEVGNRLGWQVYDHELLERIAQDMGLRASLLESVDEKRKRMGWLGEAIEGLMSLPVVSQSAYVHNLIETVGALGIHGECVIVGRGASFALPAETTLRVRLAAALKDRVAAIRREMGLSARQALRRIEALEREHIHFVQDHFLKDPTNPEHYDLIVNCSRFSVGQCANLIIDALHCRQELSKEAALARAH
jgi:cytidylate kinase